MGDERQNTDESMAEILQAMTAYLPGTLEAVRGTYQPQAQAEFDVAREFTPQYAQLQYDTLSGPGRRLAELGREMSRDEQLASAQTELDIAQGTGRELTKEALAQQELIDPEFIKSRAAVADAVAKNLAAIDPNSLTKGEEESIARGLGRVGSAVPSAAQTAFQSQAFGDALAKRRAEYNSAVQTGIASLQPMRSGLTGFEIATKRTLMPNWAQGQYTGIQTPGVNTSNMFGSQYLNNATQIQGKVMDKQKSTMDQVVQGTEAFSNIMSGIGGAAI